MGILNRSAVVVKPKQRFLDWLHAADPTSQELSLRDLVREPSIYLFPECDAQAELDDALRERCEEILTEQLVNDSLTSNRRVKARLHTLIVIGYHLHKNQSNYEDLGGFSFPRACALIQTPPVPQRAIPLIAGAVSAKVRLDSKRTVNQVVYSERSYRRSLSC